MSVGLFTRRAPAQDEKALALWGLYERTLALVAEGIVALDSDWELSFAHASSGGNDLLDVHDSFRRASALKTPLPPGTKLHMVTGMAFPEEVTSLWNLWVDTLGSIALSAGAVDGLPLQEYALRIAQKHLQDLREVMAPFGIEVTDPTMI